MADTYTPYGRIQQETGGNAGTWGTLENTAHLMAENMIRGYDSSVDLSSSDATLTISDGSQSAVGNMILHIEGTLTTDRSVTVPSLSKSWIIHNATTGAYDVTFKTSGDAGIVLPRGGKAFVYCEHCNDTREK